MTNPSDHNEKTQFGDDLYGIPCLRISGSQGQAAVAAQGAQVLSWTDPQGRERLYLSPQTLSLARAGGKDTSGPAAAGPAIRGGVPVCFPQFSDRGPLVKHGFARARIWNCIAGPDSSPAEAGGMASAGFSFADDDATRSQWPHRFEAQLLAEVDSGGLRIKMRVKNAANTPFSFTVALHTYLRVADIRQVSLQGLQGVSFEDATNGMRIAVQQEEPLRIAKEIDRVYLNPPKTLVLHEGEQASLRIEQEGFADTVVWNPGPDKAKALPDFPDDDWLRMLCVEAACAAQPVCLQPGETWEGSQRLSVPASA